jgi:hypothetical protein
MKASLELKQAINTRSAVRSMLESPKPNDADLPDPKGRDG